MTLTMTKKISLDKIKAIRSIRAGTTIDDICARYGIQNENLKSLEASYRTVPDEILAHIETVLIDHEKMRRLVADLVPDLRA
jgi:hypothetical protein